MKKNHKILILFSLIFLLSLGRNSIASTIKGSNWYNESSGVYKMQLWVTNDDVSIKNVKFSSKSLEGWSWDYADETHSSVILTGSNRAGVKEVLPTIYFEAPNVFNEFSVEWAEIAEGSYLTGTNTYSSGKWSYSKGDITNSPTPIPEGAFILVAGFLLLFWIRHRRPLSKHN
jgi:hypothetical protein